MSKEIHQLEVSFQNNCRELLENLTNASQTKMADRNLVYELEQRSDWAQESNCTTVFLSGISGAGKTTIAQVLEAKGFQKVPNVTTRTRRQNERETDNVFLTQTEFDRLHQSGDLFYPHVRNGVWQAIRLSDLDVLISGKRRMYMDKSPSSVKKLLTQFPELTESVECIYLLPPSISELYNRIIARESTMDLGLTHKAIMGRLHEEVADMVTLLDLDYRFVVNDDLKRVEEKIKELLHL